MDAILFIVFAAIAVACAVNLVLQKHPISSALSLIGVMGALAALYLLLGGEFIAMAQLIVYAGAIMVLFIFTIMLLNAGTEHKSTARMWVKFAGFPLLAAILAIAGYIAYDLAPASDGVNFGSFNGGGPDAIGKALFTE